MMKVAPSTLKCDQEFQIDLVLEHGKIYQELYSIMYVIQVSIYSIFH